MFRHGRKFLTGMILTLGALGLGGCGGEVTAPQVDPITAYRYTLEIANAGERPSGSPVLAQQADFIAATAKQFGATTRINDFEDDTPLGKMRFRNVIAEVPGRNTSQFVLIGCHYDTKKMFSHIHFVGANDGASGVGALLAMIKAAAKKKPPLTLRFVFFDGEESLYEYDHGDGLFGSRHDAAALEKSGELKQCRAMILLDMIGDRDLDITLPQGTDPDLAQRCFAAASKLGMTAKQVKWFKDDITDDHTPFKERGIPTIDLIDFDYGPNNSWWHTSEDTIDKIAPESLAAAADLGLAIAYGLR